MPHASETVGCQMVGEFVDSPEAMPADADGQRAVLSDGRGGRIAGQFVDDSQGDQAPTDHSSPMPPNVQYSAVATILFDRAISLYQQLVHGGRTELASELARARVNQAIAIRELGEDRVGLALLDQTMSLYERLVIQEGRCQLAHELSTIYDHKATILRNLGDLRGAAAFYDRAIELLGRLVQKEGRRELAEELARTQQQKRIVLSTVPPEQRPTASDDYH